MLKDRTTQCHRFWLILIALVPLSVSLSLSSATWADTASSKPAESAEAEVVTDEDFDVGLSGPVELRVAPMDQIRYPDDRPEWLDDQPDLEGKTHRWVALATPCDTPEASEESLELMKAIAIELYAHALLGPLLEETGFRVDDQWIDRHREDLVAKRYSGELLQGDMTQYESAALLEFTPEIQGELRQQWKNQELTRRLGVLGFLGFVSTVLLGGTTAALGVISRRVERRERRGAHDPLPRRDGETDRTGAAG
jgi:hypothetical protein